MKKISKLRRSALASPLLLIVALFAIGTTFSVASATTKSELTVEQRSAQIAEGKNIFLKGCSSCLPMADMSTQAMRKAPIYNEEETAALAAYVASTAPGPEIPNETMLNYERDGNTADGGTLFRTNCAMCHNFAGQGGALTQGKYAPSVMGVETKHIYEAMITGPQAMPVFSDKTITPAEKLSIIKWIKAAENEPQLGGAALGRVGPVTEGLLVWTLGLGLLIGVAVWLATKAR